MSWPQLIHVAQNENKEIVGYVLAKMEEDANPPHGHITSLAVRREYRKCGIATRLMRAAHARMKESFGAVFCSLHVRYTNRAAFHLYSETLGYKIAKIEAGYYADGEDAYEMKCEFEQQAKSKKKKMAAVSAAIQQISDQLSQTDLNKESASRPTASTAAPVATAAKGVPSSSSSGGNSAIAPQSSTEETVGMEASSNENKNPSNPPPSQAVETSSSSSQPKKNKKKK